MPVYLNRSILSKKKILSHVLGITPFVQGVLSSYFPVLRTRLSCCIGLPGSGSYSLLWDFSTSTFLWTNFNNKSPFLQEIHISIFIYHHPFMQTSLPLVIFEKFISTVEISFRDHHFNLNDKVTTIIGPWMKKKPFSPASVLS